MVEETTEPSYIDLECIKDNSYQYKVTAYYQENNKIIKSNSSKCVEIQYKNEVIPEVTTELENQE